MTREVVKVGDIIECITNEVTNYTFRKRYTVIDATSSTWVSIDDRGERDAWANPLSDWFRKVNKNEIIYELIQEL